MLFKAAERIGQLIALLAGIALFLIVIDQGRHFFDSQYTETQRTKHSFMCYHHGRVLSIPPDANKLVKKQLRIQQNVYELMDVVQQENAPVEF